jgi:hypothetical protein
VSEHELTTRQGAIKWLIYDYGIFLERVEGLFRDYVNGVHEDFYYEFAVQVMKEWNISIKDIEKYIILL